MRKTLERIIQRSVSSLSASLELLTVRRLPLTQRLDGIISRFVHTVSRPDSPAAAEMQIPLETVERENAPPVLAEQTTEKSNVTDYAPLNRGNSEIKGEAVEAVKDDSQAKEKNNLEENGMNKDLRDDMLKLVRYKVLFVKREEERVLQQGDELVSDNMDSTAFTAWKIAQLKDSDVLKGISDEDKKYLRVYFEVLDRYPRERFKYEEDQIKVLEEIRDRL